MTEAASSELVVANPLLRGGAFLIDGAIMAVVNLAVGQIYSSAGLSESTIFILFICATAAYHIAFVAVRSATLGKSLMGIYIGDSEGRAVRPDTAILRYLVLLVGGLILAIGTIVSIVLVIVDRQQRRAVHDRVAGTLVLVGRPRGAANLT